MHLLGICPVGGQVASAMHPMKTLKESWAQVHVFQEATKMREN